jgi:ADP-heptose:LPS heptosyltransferase
MGAGSAHGRGPGAGADVSRPDHHVLAVRADSMGDVLVTGPAIRAIAAKARVTVMAGPDGAAAAGLLPDIDGVVVHSLPWIVAEPGPCDEEAIAPIVRDVRRLAPDAAVIFTSFHQSPLPLALLLRLSGVPRIAAISDDYPGSLLDVRHRVDDDVHEVERARSLALAAGYPPPIGDDGRLAIADVGLGAAERSPTVVVHPGASVSARGWYPERYRLLVADLAARGIEVFVTGSRAERTLTAHVAGGGPHVHDLGGSCDLRGLAAVIAASSAVVCGNTGPAHLAAAVGTPVVSLYAPTVPASRWKPWMVDHVLLGDQQIACAGCRARICPRAGHPCLDVAVDDVVRALMSAAPVLERKDAA